ncbi:MAG: hypothetical protein RL385_5060, partial [Pseudomonadota bacterium]
SFCYVDDLVDGLFRLMTGAHIGPINLGNPGEFTIRELAERVLSAVGGKSRLVEKALPADDPKQRRPDISKAKSQLGFTPKVSLAEGLAPTIAYFREALARA